MERKRASDFPQELLNLFDLYIHGDIGRREFFEGAKKFVTATVTAAALFEMLRPNFALGKQVKQDDSRLKIETVTVPSPQGNGTIKSYLAPPAGVTGRLPAILVVHENRGLNPHIFGDIARRLWPCGIYGAGSLRAEYRGGIPATKIRRRSSSGRWTVSKMTEDFVAVVGWLKKRPDGIGRRGAIGFCFGGGIVNTLAVRLGSELNAGVAFYGAQPSAEDTAKIKAPMMLHYGALDQRITGGWPAWEIALKANHVNYQGFVYEGANHGFNNDTTPRYDESAAKLPWQRSLDFFNKYSERLMGRKCRNN